MLDVVTYGSDMLHRRSENVEKVDQDIKNLVKEMYQTMYATQGIGLAAVQVGVLKRIFVTDVPEGGKYVMINPQIVDFSKKKSTCEEGCLSVPGVHADVERAAEVTVEYTDLNGERKSLHAKGLLATCIQHEYDHLEGVLFIDKIDPQVRLNLIKKYRKQQRV